MSLSDGNIFRPATAINEWILRRWYYENFLNNSSPMPVTPLAMLPDSLDPGAAPMGSGVSMSLVDRKGLLALWEIDVVSVSLFNPNDGNVVVCGGWDQTGGGLARDSILGAPRWGTNPACAGVPYFLNTLPQHLVMLTVSTPRKKAHVGNFIWEYPVWVEDVGTSDDVNEWWGVLLDAHNPDVALYELDGVSSPVGGDSDVPCASDPMYGDRPL